MNLSDYDRRLIADPQIGPRVFAGARALAMHRMMRDAARHWDAYTEAEKLDACGEASAVMRAPIGEGSSLKRYAAFGITDYYPAGGWGDFVETFATIPEAVTRGLADKYNDRFQVIDLITGDEVANGRVRQ